MTKYDGRHRATSISRRGAIALTGAALAAPALGQNIFADTTERISSLDQFHGIVAAKDGEIVLERRERGPSLETPVNVKSVSKSIVSTILGAAIMHGDISGVDATIGDLAPNLIPEAADEDVRDITLEDLVTLRAGLESTSGANYGNWVSSSNWVQYALSQAMVGTPGGNMIYSTGTTHVLGAVIEVATGRSLYDLCRDYIATPLNVTIPPWTRDPQGHYLGGNEMALSPYAMLRIGEAMRLGGELDGSRIVSEEWVDAAFTRRTRSRFSGLGYGYGWFLGRIDGADMALARGYGGQVILVVPSRGVTVAITSDPTRPARSGGYFGDLMRLLDQAVLPELRSV